MGPHQDPRRRIPGTDHLLNLPAAKAAQQNMNRNAITQLARHIQDQARRGELNPEDVEPHFVQVLGEWSPSSLTPVLNATGVIVHTNLGRAPLSDEARAAVYNATEYVDVELDLASGFGSRRGAATRAALLEACPDAHDALVVNNGAAALLLAVTALAPSATPDVVVSRGELVEIGAGFRLPDLMTSTGARLTEVGTTNRTYLEDYARALSDSTGCIMKIHPSNYRVEGFTSTVATTDLAELARAHQIPLVVDVGSGLLEPTAALPTEPDLGTALKEGADLVLASGDKLLGGPQAGILLGRADLIATLAQHPLARAVRADKLALAALEATLHSRLTPVREYLEVPAEYMRTRTHRVATLIRTQLGRENQNDVDVVPHEGRVGGGGGTGVALPGWALSLPEYCAAQLRTGTPAVLPRVSEGVCLVDLRCIPEKQDEALTQAVIAALTPVK